MKENCPKKQDYPKQQDCLICPQSNSTASTTSTSNSNSSIIVLIIILILLCCSSVLMEDLYIQRKIIKKNNIYTFSKIV